MTFQQMPTSLKKKTETTRKSWEYIKRYSIKIKSKVENKKKQINSFQVSDARNLCENCSGSKNKNLLDLNCFQENYLKTTFDNSTDNIKRNLLKK